MFSTQPTALSVGVVFIGALHGRQSLRSCDMHHHKKNQTGKNDIKRHEYASQHLRYKTNTRYIFPTPSPKYKNRFGRNSNV